MESGFLGEAAIARLRAGYGRAERTVFGSSRRAAGEDQTQLICLTTQVSSPVVRLDLEGILFRRHAGRSLLPNNIVWPA